MKQHIFYVGLGMLFTHELDAMPNHEWRGLPLLGAAPDELGMQVFLLAHVPLFALAIAFVASLNHRVRDWTRIVLSAFLFVHGVLHVLGRNRPTYEFTSWTSSILIHGAAICGILYLLLALRETIWRRGLDRSRARHMQPMA
jgi:hypothetical protein